MTNAMYIQCPVMSCWNCGKLIFGNPINEIARNHADIKIAMALQIAELKTSIVMWLNKNSDHLPMDEVIRLQNIIGLVK